MIVGTCYMLTRLGSSIPHFDMLQLDFRFYGLIMSDQVTRGYKHRTAKLLGIPARNPPLNRIKTDLQQCPEPNNNSCCVIGFLTEHLDQISSNYIYIYICNISVRESCRFSFDYEHGSEASRRRISQRTHPNELNMAPLKFHYLESVKPVVAAVRWPFQLCLQEVLWKRHVKYSHFLVFFPISICGISIYNRFVFLVDNIAPQAYTSWKYIIH